MSIRSVPLIGSRVQTARWHCLDKRLRIGPKPKIFRLCPFRVGIKVRSSRPCTIRMFLLVAESAGRTAHPASDDESTLTLRSRLGPCPGGDYKKTVHMTHPHERHPKRSRLFRIARYSTQQHPQHHNSRKQVTRPLRCRESTLAKFSRTLFGRWPRQKVAAQFTLHPVR